MLHLPRSGGPYQVGMGTKITPGGSLLWISQVSDGKDLTTTVRAAAPVWALWSSPEQVSCQPHVSVATVSPAPRTHGGGTSFVWAALEGRSDCCLNPKSVFLLLLQLLFWPEAWQTVVSISYLWHIKGEKLAKEKGHREKLLGIWAIFYFLTQLVVINTLSSLFTILYFYVYILFCIFVLFHYF